MSLRTAAQPLFVCVIIGMQSAAHAARPFITDDARMVDAKACQVESWVRRNVESTELWLVPACNPTGNLELTLGGARIDDAGDDHSRALVMQAKTLFRPLQADGFGLGLAVGNLRRAPESAGARGAGDVYGYVPASFSLKGDARVLHVNIGALREAAEHRTRVTAGLGIEWQVLARSWLIAETFDQERGRPFFQLGVRHWLVPNRVQADVTFGDRFGHRDAGAASERWMSIGVRLLSPAFLP